MNPDLTSGSSSNAPVSAADIAGPNPLLDFLGIRLATLEVGRAVFDMHVGPHHLNRQGTLQGGVIATLLDAASGYAGLQHSEHAGITGAVTLMLSISYHARVDSGHVVCEGTVTRAGRNIYFAQARLVDEAGELVASAQGTFKRSIGRARSMESES